MLSPEKSDAIDSLAFPPDDEARMSGLMERNNQGTLTHAERDEMEAVRRVGTLLGIRQMRARIAIATQHSAE